MTNVAVWYMIIALANGFNFTVSIDGGYRDCNSVGHLVMQQQEVHQAWCVVEEDMYSPTFGRVEENEIKE